MEPNQLKSLDAIHLAAALELGDELDAIITYDNRLAEAGFESSYSECFGGRACPAEISPATIDS